MNSQRGFIVLGGAALLIAAAAAGGVIVMDYATSDNASEGATAATSAQAPVAKADSAPVFIGTSNTEAPYSGDRYRNGGYFGDGNSDESLENAGQ